MAIFTAKRWQVVMASPIASGGEPRTPLLACVCVSIRRRMARAQSMLIIVSGLLCHQTISVKHERMFGTGMDGKKFFSGGRNDNLPSHCTCKYYETTMICKACLFVRSSAKDDQHQNSTNDKLNHKALHLHYKGI